MSIIGFYWVTNEDRSYDVACALPKMNCQRLSEAADDWIDEIDSPKHKLLARVQASELAAANKMLRDFVPPGTRIEVRDYHNNTNNNDRALNNLERQALEYLISDQFLAKWQFSLSEYGEFIDSNNYVVLKAATVDAVKKALTHL